VYCTNCGQRLADDANFCGYCGQRIIQPDLASEAEHVKRVADKAEDIVIQDDNLSSCDNVKSDYVAQKASYIGEKSNPQPSNIPSSVQWENKPKYIETRSACPVSYLCIIKKENTSTNRSSYRLLNTVRNTRSEWFDYIQYCGYYVFYIERDGLKGLMEDYFKYQLWDQMNTGAESYYCVAKNGKWAVVTIKNKKIEHVTPYEYDDMSSLVKGATVIKKDGKYGYLFYSLNGEIRMVPCVLDHACEFEYKKRYGKGTYASVIYQGKSYEMDGGGRLCVEKIDWQALIFFIGAIVLYSGLVWMCAVFVIGGLYEIIFNGMPFLELMERPITNSEALTWAVISLIFVIILCKEDASSDNFFKLKSISYLETMNVASAECNDK